MSEIRAETARRALRVLGNLDGSSASAAIGLAAVKRAVRADADAELRKALDSLETRTAPSARLRAVRPLAPSLEEERRLLKARIVLAERWATRHSLMRSRGGR